MFCKTNASFLIIIWYHTWLNAFCWVYRCFSFRHHTRIRQSIWIPYTKIPHALELHQLYIWKSEELCRFWNCHKRTRISAIFTVHNWRRLINTNNRLYGWFPCNSLFIGSFYNITWYSLCYIILVVKPKLSILQLLLKKTVTYTLLGHR